MLHEERKKGGTYSTVIYDRANILKEIVTKRRELESAVILLKNVLKVILTGYIISEQQRAIT